MTTGQEAYQEFLRSDFWKEVSARKKAGLKHCQRCGRRASQLESHHVRYPKDWYDTKLEDLIAVCWMCHEVLHGRREDAPVVKPKPKKPEKRAKVWSEALSRNLKAKKKPKRVGNFVNYPDGRRVYAPTRWSTL